MGARPLVYPSTLAICFGICIALLGPQTAEAVGAKPNKAQVFACLQAEIEDDGALSVSGCAGPILAPCDRWFEPRTIDLYSSCLRGLGWNWSRLLNSGLEEMQQTRGTDFQGDITKRIRVWRDGLRRTCQKLPWEDTGSVHLREANRRACTLAVNVVLTFLVESRPDDLVGDPPVEA